MRRLLRRYIPSMFHRRLLLLLVAAGIVAVALGAQAARLTTGEAHRQSLQRVEDSLRSTKFIPTVRGRVLDRWGRVLATDEPGYDVAVDYRVISGDWAHQQARASARDANRDRWAELSPTDRRALVDEHQRRYDQQVQDLWRTLAELGGVDRAEIERRKSQVTARVQQVSSHLWSYWRRQREKELGEPVPLPEAVQPIGEQRRAHSILRDVDERTRLVIQGFRAEADEDPALDVWREVEIRRPKQRRYPRTKRTVTVDRTHLPIPLHEGEPLDVPVRGVGVHIVGLMRDVWKEDLEGEDARPFDPQNDLGGYLAGDRVGRFGIEAGMETRLRGTRGKVIRYLDTDRTRRIEPTPGKDVKLTVDIDLQAKVRAVMSPEVGLMTYQPWHMRKAEDKARLGERLNGAAVVLDAQTSEVLAAVSVPGMPLDALENEPAKIYEDRINRPYVNRTIARAYQPGSPVKPLMLASAASAGVHPPREPILCRGYLNEDDPQHYRCWIFKQYMSKHGMLKGAEAIARSCNVYFYTLGRDMGVPRISEWYGSFGLGAPTGVGLPEEVGGDLPNPQRARRFHDADAIFMGIGQGPVRWTPMQAAGAYAALLSDGRALKPTIIKPGYRDSLRKQYRINLDRQAVDDAVQGLHDVVNASYGTGHSLVFENGKREPVFDVEGVTVYGKSGTAQAVPLRIDSDEDGHITRNDNIVKRGDHAWFIAMPKPDGKDKPTHIVVVVVGYAGSGKQVAGPVANQIVHLLQTEGYL